MLLLARTNRRLERRGTMGAVEFLPGMNFGLGVDTLTGEIRGGPLVHEVPQDPTGIQGQTVEFYLDKVESLSELNAALGISVEAEASFGIGGFSAKAKYAKSCEMTRFGLYLILRVTVVNAARLLQNPTLTGEASALLAAGQGERFRRRFGDRFIRGVITGGEYFCVLQVKTKNKKTREEISLDVEGSYGTAGASVSFQQTIESISSRSQLTVSSFQAGGDSRQADTPKDAMAKALSFPPSVATDLAVAYSAILSDYEILDLPAEPNWIDLRNARDVIKHLMATRNDYIVLQNDINYVLAHQDEFVPPIDTAGLDAARNRIAKTINVITDAASRAAAEPSSATFPDDLAIGDVPIPDEKDPPESGRPRIPVPRTLTKGTPQLAPVRIGGGVEAALSRAIGKDGASRFLSN